MDERLQYLLTQYENNSCSRGEMEELFACIRQMNNSNPALKEMIKKVYKSICEQHPSFAYVNENGQLVLNEVDDHFIPPNHLSHKKLQSLKIIRVYKRIMLFASVLIVSSLVLIGVKRFSDSRPNEIAIINTKTLAAGPGENRMFMLPDSSQVWLNAGSFVTIPEQFTGNERRVELNGEAFFKIRQQKNIPFVVNTPDVSIHSKTNAVVNIKAYQNENDIVVSAGQGIVTVQKLDNHLATLTAGRMIKFGLSDESITEGKFPVNLLAAWQWGELVYENTMLKDVIADLQRRFNVTIRLDEPQKAKWRLNANFKSGTDLDDILQTVANITQSQLDSTGNLYTIR